jgi:hypothetical protein
MSQSLFIIIKLEYGIEISTKSDVQIDIEGGPSPKHCLKKLTKATPLTVDGTLTRAILLPTCNLRSDSAALPHL